MNHVPDDAVRPGHPLRNEKAPHTAAWIHARAYGVFTTRGSVLGCKAGAAHTGGAAEAAAAASTRRIAVAGITASAGGASERGAYFRIPAVRAVAAVTTVTTVTTVTASRTACAVEAAVAAIYSPGLSSGSGPPSPRNRRSRLPYWTSQGNLRSMCWQDNLHRWRSRTTPVSTVLLTRTLSTQSATPSALWARATGPVHRCRPDRPAP